MGKITGCFITLTNNDAAVYRPGETVKGYALLDVEEEVRINSVKIFLTGKALTQWVSSTMAFSSSTKSGLETYVNVFKWLVKEPIEKLTAGRHKYTFSFQLPNQALPSSFEGKYGAVRYWVRLQVDKKFPGFNANYYRHFTVLANIDANDPALKKTFWYKNTKTMSKALGLGNAGTVTLKACTDRQVYCPGDKIQVSLEATNESTKDCGIVKACLFQNVEFRAGSETQNSSTPIRNLSGSVLGAGKSIKWDKQKLTVQPCPSSTAQLTCHIIKVTYHILVEVEINMGFNLPVKLPVTIGTIPLGASLPKQESQSAPGRDGLKYEMCQYGIQTFKESQDDFMNMQFRPKNVFVENPVLAQSCSDNAKPAAGYVDARQQTSPKAVSPASAPAPTVSSASPLSNSSVSLETSRTEKSATPAVQSKTSENCPSNSSRPEPHTAMTYEDSPRDAPPTYEETIAMGLAPQDCTVEAGPMPYHLMENGGKGSVLLLLFPMGSSDLVQSCFKSSAANMHLHHGQILGFTKKLSMMPSNMDTSAVLLYFPSQRASLSWLQNQTATFPDLASSWWALVAENTVFKSVQVKDLPSPLRAQSPAGVVALTYGKLKWPARNTPERDEAERVVKHVRELASQISNHKVLNSSKVLYAWGDWSSFPFRESDQCVLYVRQYDSREKYEAHKNLVAEDIEGNKVYEYFQEPIIRHALSTSDLYLFRN